MREPPRFETERLVLRPVTFADAPWMQLLAGERDVASTTTNIPHPYEDGMAQQWIQEQREKYEKGEEVNFAIALRSENLLLGILGLRLFPQHARAELGYWIGKPYWNCGYCTEAARAVLRYGFEALGLNRIYAYHYGGNPASGRVLEKIGMRYEGRQRQHINRWGRSEDLEAYGILKSDYESPPRENRG